MFLEDAFTESHAERLRAFFPRVELFRTHFPDEKRKLEQSVKDPRIIQFCDKKCWLLVTIDSNMANAHRTVICETKVCILATAHNNADDMEEWVEGLVLARAKVLRHFAGKTEKPWFGTFTRQGEVSIRHIAKFGEHKKPKSATAMRQHQTV